MIFMKAEQQPILPTDHLVQKKCYCLGTLILNCFCLRPLRKIIYRSNIINLFPLPVSGKGPTRSIPTYDKYSIIILPLSIEMSSLYLIPNFRFNGYRMK